LLPTPFRVLTLFTECLITPGPSSFAAGSVNISMNSNVYRVSALDRGVDRSNKFGTRVGNLATLEIKLARSRVFAKTITNVNLYDAHSPSVLGENSEDKLTVVVDPANRANVNSLAGNEADFIKGASGTIFTFSGDKAARGGIADRTGASSLTNTEVVVKISDTSSGSTTGSGTFGSGSGAIIMDKLDFTLLLKGIAGVASTLVTILTGVFINLTITIVIKIITNLGTRSSRGTISKETTIDTSDLASTTAFTITTCVRNRGKAIVVGKNTSVVDTFEYLAIDFRIRARSISITLVATSRLEAALLVGGGPAPLACSICVKGYVTLSPGGFGRVSHNSSMNSQVGGFAARRALNDRLIRGDGKVLFGQISLSRRRVTSDFFVTNEDVNFVHHPTISRGQIEDPVSGVSGGDSSDFDISTSQKSHFKSRARITRVADTVGSQLATSLSADSSLTSQARLANLIVRLKFASVNCAARSDPALITRFVSRTVRVNRSMLALFGFSGAEVSGTFDSIITISILIDVSIAVIINAVARVSRHGGGDFTGITEVSSFADQVSSISTGTTGGLLNGIVGKLLNDTCAVNTGRLITRVIYLRTVVRFLASLRAQVTVVGGRATRLEFLRPTPSGSVG